MVRCSTCGANVTPRDPTCSYCGGANPEHRPPNQHVQALLAGARSLHQLGNFLAAAELLQLVIARDAELFDAYFLLADCLSRLHDLPGGIRAMTQAQLIRPGHCVIHYNLAVLLQQHGDVEQARACLERAAALVDTSTLADKEGFRRRIRETLASLPG